MKTEALISTLEGLGYAVKKDSIELVVYSDNVYIATVYIKEMYVIDTSGIVKLPMNQRERLFKLLSAYASTSIEHREDAKRHTYKLDLPKEILGERKYIVKDLETGALSLSTIYDKLDGGRVQPFLYNFEVEKLSVAVRDYLETHFVKQEFKNGE